MGVAGLTIIGWLSVEMGKVLVHRMRPPAATVHALVVETKPDSYPSGHTAFAAALVFAVAATMLLAHHPTRTVWLVGIPFIVIVAASRLYLGAHYLSDVIASAVFAGGTVLIAVAIAGPWLLRLRNREESTTAGTVHTTRDAASHRRSRAHTDQPSSPAAQQPAARRRPNRCTRQPILDSKGLSRSDAIREHPPGRGSRQD